MGHRDHRRNVVALRRADASHRPDQHQAGDPAGGQAGPLPAPGCAAGAPLVGACLDTAHPTLCGRVLVRWAAPGGGPQERWLPALHRLAVREGDRVLVVQPAGWPEPIVTGVVDGYAERPAAAARPAALLQLRPDETLRVCSQAGVPLLELRETETGPQLRLLGRDVDLEAEGELRLRGRRVRIEAERGELELRARDDVHVCGENINLN